VPEYSVGRLTDRQSTWPVLVFPPDSTVYCGSHLSTGDCSTIRRLVAVMPFSSPGFIGNSMRGADRRTTRATEPTWRASTREPPNEYRARIFGLPDRSTSSSRAPPTPRMSSDGGTSPLAMPMMTPVVSTIAWSPARSRLPSAMSWPSASDPVTLRLAASTTLSVPLVMVTIRLPSVLTRSGSSTPASWVLVDEWSGVVAPGAAFSAATGPGTRAESATAVRPLKKVRSPPGRP
jgi:hypothetical protein